MPKVIPLTSDERLKAKIRKFVKGNLAAQNMKQKDLARCLGKNENTFKSQVHSGRFDYIDLVEMCEVFEVSDKEKAELLKYE